MAKMTKREMSAEDKRALKQLVRSSVSLVIHIGRAIRQGPKDDKDGAFNSAMLDCDEIVDGIEEVLP